MTRLLIALALLLIGFGAGWQVSAWRMKAGQADTAQARADAITNSVTTQITQRQGELQREQDATAGLLAHSRLIRAGSADIRLEITHANFTVPPPPGVVASCPDPVGSAEFARLYARAARGGDPAATGGTSTR